jgi:hypothetical protein
MSVSTRSRRPPTSVTSTAFVRRLDLGAAGRVEASLTSTGRKTTGVSTRAAAASRNSRRQA